MSPSANSSYILTCTNSTGSGTDSATIAVAPPLPTVTLTAAPNAIDSGQSTTLTWSSTNATACNASGSWSGTRSLTGNASVAPVSNSTYVLTCTSSAGSDAASVTVTVSAVGYFPQPESAGGWRSLVTANLAPDAAQKAEILSRTGVDWDLLEEAWDHSVTLSPNGAVLVIRNGWVVGEWGAGSSQHVASVTKSLTGMAIARLLDMSDQGQLAQPIGLGSLAHQYLPAPFGSSDPAKQQITIEQLLTKSSGLRPEDPDALTLAQRLTHPMDAEPGEEWTYSSLPPNLLSMIVQQQTGTTLAEFFNAEIATAVGASPLGWGSIDGGYTDGAAWATTTARDLARIGHLALKGGIWNDGSGDRQVISANRISALTQWAPSLAGAAFRVTPGTEFTVPADAPNHYGHLWWTNRTGIALGTAVPTDAFFMHGYRDNLAIIVPSRNLIVVRLGSEGPAVDPQFRVQFMQRVMASLVN